MSTGGVSGSTDGVALDPEEVILLEIAIGIFARVEYGDNNCRGFGAEIRDEAGSFVVQRAIVGLRSAVAHKIGGATGRIPFCWHDDGLYSPLGEVPKDAQPKARGVLAIMEAWMSC